MHNWKLAFLFLNQVSIKIGNTHPWTALCCWMEDVMFDIISWRLNIRLLFKILTRQTGLYSATYFIRFKSKLHKRMNRIWQKYYLYNSSVNMSDQFRFSEAHSCLNTLAPQGSTVVECLTRDWGASWSSLTGVTVLCPWARQIYPSLVLVQPRKTLPDKTK